MSRSVFIVLFILLFLAIDWYIFKGVKQLIRNWEPLNQNIATILYWSIPVISLLIFYAVFFVFKEQPNNNKRYFFVSVILIIYISKTLTALVLLTGDIIRLGQNIYQWLKELFTNTTLPKTESPIISRSEFITKAAMIVGATHIGAMSWGIISGAYDYRIRRVTLELSNLPKQFEGLKLIQISDIHSGSFYNKTAVQGGVDMLLKEKPDMVFFTGDLVNNKADELKEDYFDIFKQVKAPLGVYSTLGNHDYGDYHSWPNERAKVENINNLLEAHKLMGWQILMDENKAITVDGASIGVLGIQNWGVGFAQYGQINKALINTEQFDINLLLSHDPSHWRAQVLGQTNIDASFAGHTHGMQYGIEIGDFKWSPAQWRYKEWAGLYKENNQQLYVNRGYGFLGFPGRVGILPEITVFELKKSLT
jgi:predicted MPP superfamily phosphohydrolase